MEYKHLLGSLLCGIISAKVIAVLEFYTVKFYKNVTENRTERKRGHLLIGLDRLL